MPPIPPTPVAGIGFEPELGGLPLEAPNTSSGSASILAIVIASTTAGTLALGGAAWYARGESVAGLDAEAAM